MIKKGKTIPKAFQNILKELNQHKPKHDLKMVVNFTADQQNQACQTILLKFIWQIMKGNQ